MSRSSCWIETELERGGDVCLVPMRSRLEARKDRLRTSVQKLEDNGTWVTVHRTAWVRSPGAHRLTQAKMDEAANEVADVLIAQVEALLP